MLIHVHYESRLAKLILPERFVAFTFRNHIFFRRSFTSTSTMAHEVMHCMQYKKYGTIGFLFRYLKYTLKWGYDLNPLERQAYNFAMEAHKRFTTIVANCENKFIWYMLDSESGNDEQKIP